MAYVPNSRLPGIRPLIEATREEPMTASYDDRSSRALPGFRFRTFAFAAMLVFFALRSSAQSEPVPSQAPAQQQPAPASKTDAPSSPKPPAKPKKVFTNEDLETASVPVEQPASGPVDYFGAILICDAACEQQASRNVSLTFDGTAAAAWDRQIGTARARLVADTVFQERLREMVRLQRILCNYINPQSRQRTPAPGAESYDAKTGAEANRYMKETGRTLDESFQIQFGKLHTRSNEVRFSDPATGALMEVLINRVTQCWPYVP